ncbi:E3 ubiquitin-protein ligase TRIM33-like [Ruditapes philippinarum]|uniref:E3 ubiquitin-protein ligase TRIM33-like n=1 Tax=Ruditapes philippinarum TaxID=129788 RepID=UPI00295B13EC|nr:E3 ubiquitin-protein ligase TRIM33-like [Ruditapes philippinarum]
MDKSIPDIMRGKVKLQVILDVNVHWYINRRKDVMFRNYKMSDEVQEEETNLEQIEYKTETLSTDGNLTRIENTESAEIVSSCANSDELNCDTGITNTPELTEESSAKLMEDKAITGNDGINESTETESCGVSGGYVGSEEEFSNPCQPCLENDRNIDSLLYCVECEDYLCEKCVEMHRMVKPTKKHKLVPKDVLNNCGDELMINREEECPIHMKEVIEWFCISDDKLCCNICKATEHNKCESIVAIASVAETTNMQSIEEKIAETQSKLNDAIEKKNVDITNLDEDRNDSLQVLKQIKRDTEDTFQRLLRSLEKENQKVENIQKREEIFFGRYRKLFKNNQGFKHNSNVASKRKHLS